MNEREEIRFIDLFSGIGGFRLGLERAGGFQCVWSCDNSEWANSIYLRRFKPKRGEHFTANIRQVDENKIPNHDFITAGFPCQAFSYAGKRQGFKDTRGTLFFEIARIAKAKKPSLLLLENVQGLLTHDQGRTFNTILQTLDELGYDAEWQVLDSRGWIPQRRRRIFIIGHLREKPTSLIFPIFEADEGCGQVDEEAPYVSTLTKSYSADGYGVGRPYVIYDKPRFEGKGTMRALTPLEFEKLQGFPPGWTLGIPQPKRYETLGNAVTVDVIEYLGKCIKEVWDDRHGQ